MTRVRTGYGWVQRTGYAGTPPRSGVPTVPTLESGRGDVGKARVESSGGQSRNAAFDVLQSGRIENRPTEVGKRTDAHYFALHEGGS